MDDEKNINEPTAAYATTADQIVSKPIILERGGKPVLVLMPYEEYRRLQRIEMDARAREKITSTTSLRPRRNTLDKAWGLLATDRSAPSDAEIEQWLDEHRTEKYG
jgi:PHD/YefM family antitoxin component YafN of YafNO toxin-antitoxin module